MSGDDCLRRIAGVIAECAARAADLPARYGGEEFACILPETDQAGAIAIAEKIRLGIMALAIPHNSSDTAGCVTASLGVVTIACAADNPAAGIIDLADSMLYRAKSLGRNRVESDASDFGRKYLPADMEGSLVHLAWQDDYCSGNLQIDTLHRELFRASNELLDAIFSARPDSETAALVSGLLEGGANHFRDEEAILESLNYSGLKQHAEEHARLYDEGVLLAQSLTTEVAPPVGKIFTFLVYEVVLQHMLGADREFFPLVGEARELSAERKLGGQQGS